MNWSSSPAGSMKLVGGDLCLDFVNTVGGRSGAAIRADKLVAYADLLAWARHTDSTREADARRLARLAAARPAGATAALERAVAFREALHRTLGALVRRARPARVDVAIVDAAVAEARRHERLAPGEAGLRWEWRDAGADLGAPVWPVARAAAELLTEGRLDRLHACGGESCGWLFLDRSRSGTRQWCTMEDCGNVSKVRRFRRRHASL
ncbi:MAG: CGNR zinc finger domain-containing protein [Vicinamibacteria bacterium]